MRHPLEPKIAQPCHKIVDNNAAVLCLVLAHGLEHQNLYVDVNIVKGPSIKQLLYPNTQLQLSKYVF